MNRGRPEPQRNATAPSGARLALQVAHGALFALCGLLAFLLRFDFGVPRDYVPHLIAGVGAWSAVKLAVFHIESVDRSWACVPSTLAIPRLLAVNVQASLGAAIVIVLLGPPGFPQSLYLIDFALAVIATVGIQLSLPLWVDRTRAPCDLVDSEGAIGQGVRAHGREASLDG